MNKALHLHSSINRKTRQKLKHAAMPPELITGHVASVQNTMLVPSGYPPRDIRYKIFPGILH